MQLSFSNGQVLAEVKGRLGVLTLNRANALNALSLGMVRDLTQALDAWAQPNSGVSAVLIKGANRPGKPAAFCAGGDIRFFHQAALAGDPQLEDFFSEEYALNFRIHRYRLPVMVWMDGICMGGGMGLAQGAKFRVVTASSQLAMPETQIGLFPDVGGGWFLARCPGRFGEFLALTGEHLGAADSLALGLADWAVPAQELPALEERLASQPALDQAVIRRHMQALAKSAEQVAEEWAPARWAPQQAWVDDIFSADDMPTVLTRLEKDGSALAEAVLKGIHKRSPLMGAVSLEQVRREREISLADALRLERGLVRRCFHLRPGAASETVEGIRALVVDKDQSPRWNPASAAEVSAEMVAAYFEAPWPEAAHPLRDLRELPA